MRLHEHQGKDLLRRYGVPVPAGRVCRSPATVPAALCELGLPVAVKAQVLAGGRARGRVCADANGGRTLLDGGVHVVEDPERAGELVATMLGGYLLTEQTGPRGQAIHAVYLEAAGVPDAQWYCAVTLDRTAGCPQLLLAEAGGTDVETRAAERPAGIHRAAANPETGLDAAAAAELAAACAPAGAPRADLAACLRNLVRCYLDRDATLVEVNPLALTAAGELLALDAKVAIDDNALFRQEELAEARDETAEDPRERAAARRGMSFVALSGSIGCLVNGAGLAMAVMDAIAAEGADSGAAPANFLDVGGGADAEQVGAAFGLILDDPAVRAVMVNVFGGIMDCAVIARGILAAVRERPPAVPLVVRLAGNGAEEGRRLLAGGDVEIIQAEGLRDAVRKAIAAAVVEG